MSRRKLERFVCNEESPLVIQSGKPLYTTIKGQWRRLLFQNDHPLVVELGCGKGEYTIGLAQQNPSTNYIGVDLKGDRIARGVVRAAKLGLTNVAFLRADIRFLTEFFIDNEISCIWITFPDPHIGDRGKKWRLTNPSFLEVYRQMLVGGGLLHLKTDNDEFFDYTVSVMAGLTNEWMLVDSTRDLYNSLLNKFQVDIKTRYEEEFFSKGYSIKYAIFSNIKM